MSKIIEWVTQKRWAAFVGMVMAAITLGMAFGVDLTPTQVGAISAFLTAVGAFIIQAGVFSKDTHERELNTARSLSYSAGQQAGDDGSVDLSLIVDLLAVAVVALFLSAVVQRAAALMWALIRGAA